MNKFEKQYDMNLKRNMSASAHRLIFSIKYITHLCIINTYFFFIIYLQRTNSKETRFDSIKSAI